MLDDEVLSRLRTEHPDIWDALGPPTRMIDDWGMARARAIEDFCRRPDFVSQCDRTLVKMATFASMYHKIYALVVGLAVVGLPLAVWKCT